MNTLPGLQDEGRAGQDWVAIATEVKRKLEAYTWAVPAEVRLQDELARVLAETPYLVAREAVVGPRDRFDFLVEGHVVVEVKTGGSRAQVLRQLFRYAKLERVKALVLATTSLRLLPNLPTTLLGKPLLVAYLRP